MLLFGRARFAVMDSTSSHFASCFCYACSDRDSILNAMMGPRLDGAFATIILHKIVK